MLLKEELKTLEDRDFVEMFRSLESDNIYMSQKGVEAHTSTLTNILAYNNSSAILRVKVFFFNVNGWPNFHIECYFLYHYYFDVNFQIHRRSYQH